ncbi:MAG: hypothetical protein B6D34_09085 [Candidatus Brocadia sp. UTAMX1]|jgi:hypothetical protein|nr:MAG: hypothetical protein B6D34_09085 [Candidatus Brocadia sp. UTAMX1]
MRNTCPSFSIKNKEMGNMKIITWGLIEIYHTILCVFMLFMLCSSLHAHSDGAPIGCLGAGIDKYDWNLYAPRSTFTCGNLGCHYQYPIDIGKAKLKLFVISKCEPGQIVDILVSFEKTNTEFHGFEITANDRYYNQIVGTFINPDNDEDIQIIGNGLFVTHTKKGTQQKFWHVKWQAPPADFPVQNPVRLYAMGVEADNDGTATGDYIYKATRLIEVVPKMVKKGQIKAIKKE